MLACTWSAMAFISVVHSSFEEKEDTLLQLDSSFHDPWRPEIDRSFPLQGEAETACSVWRLLQLSQQPSNKQKLHSWLIRINMNSRKVSKEWTVRETVALRNLWEWKTPSVFSMLSRRRNLHGNHYLLRRRRALLLCLGCYKAWPIQGGGEATTANHKTDNMTGSHIARLSSQILP